MAAGSPQGPWRVIVEGSCVIVNSVIETGQGFGRLAGVEEEEEVEEEETVGATGADVEEDSASRA